MQPTLRQLRCYSESVAMLWMALIFEVWPTRQKRFHRGGTGNLRQITAPVAAGNNFPQVFECRDSLNFRVFPNDGLFKRERLASRPGAASRSIVLHDRSTARLPPRAGSNLGRRRVRGAPFRTKQVLAPCAV